MSHTTEFMDSIRDSSGLVKNLSRDLMVNVDIEKWFIKKEVQICTDE